MQNFIQLPTENVYELKSKKFYKSKLAKRLQKKFEPKPFEENYKPVYWISLSTSYFCNVFSILTASTFVFTYFYSILAKIPYPVLWASLFSGIILILIEALQRILAPKLFKEILQFGFKVSSMIAILIIVCLSGLSIFFSFNGGFDVVENLSSEPIYSEPNLQDIEAIRSHYSGLIAEAGKDAREYKKSKIWHGRLSDKQAKVYKELLDKKATLQSKMLAKINTVEAQNREALYIAKEEYKSSLESYKSSLETKGGGLAKFAIIAQLIFFISIFFSEYYDYKTASQYALSEKSYSQSKPNNSKNFNFGQLQNNSPKQAPIARNQIGFQTNPKKQSKPLLQQGKTDKTKTVFVKDKHTIEHNGKRYTLKDVNNFINIYEKRVMEAINRGKESLSLSRTKTLEYWKERKAELYNLNQSVNNEREIFE